MSISEKAFVCAIIWAKDLLSATKLYGSGGSGINLESFRRITSGDVVCTSKAMEKTLTQELKKHQSCKLEQPKSQKQRNHKVHQLLQPNTTPDQNQTEALIGHERTEMLAKRRNCRQSESDDNFPHADRPLQHWPDNRMAPIETHSNAPL